MSEEQRFLPCGTYAVIEEIKKRREAFIGPPMTPEIYKAADITMNDEPTGIDHGH